MLEDALLGGGKDKVAMFSLDFIILFVYLFHFWLFWVFAVVWASLVAVHGLLIVAASLVLDRRL